MANKMPSIVLEGDQELMDLIDSLPGRMLTATGQALRAVGKPIVADARRRLTKGHGLRTGQLKKSLGVRKVLTYRQQQRVVMYIGPRAGFKTTVGGRPHDPQNIAHLVEFGHRVGNAIAPDVPARPFLRPAIDSNRSAFLERMKEALRRTLEKKAKPARRRAA